MVWPSNVSLALALLASYSTGARDPGSGPELTVYNQGFAVVKEVRSFDLRTGRQAISVVDVPSQIDPTSVSIKALQGPGFSVLEQNYQYDLISPAAILEKSIGARVKLLRHFGEKTEVVEGELLSAPSTVSAPDGSGAQTYRGLVIRTDTGAVILDPVGEVEVESVPNGLISRPTLMWDLSAGGAGQQGVELSYITRGMSWTSDYVFTLDETKSVGVLNGWVTLNNQSGKSYENSPLKLLAGEVNTVSDDSGVAPSTPRAMTKVGSMGGRAAFQEQSLFEYHLYTLQRPANIRNNETKQLSLLSSQKVHYVKRLIIDPYEGMGEYRPYSGGLMGVPTVHAKVRVDFFNTKANGLAVPLPKGRIRLYQRDDSGSVQFIGEDRIDHTPRNEKLSLLVGEAFDVVANRKRMSYHEDDRSTTETFSVEVRNRKTTPVEVELLDRHYWDWKITDASDPFEKLDANTADFHLKLGPNATKKVTFTVVTKW